MEEFLAVQRGNKGPGSAGWWDRVLPALDERQSADLMEAAASRDISHRTIAVVLGQWGFDVSAAQVGHWRRTYVR